MATIFALSSGALPAGVAVIRLSGGQARVLVQKFCGQVPKPRNMALLPIKTAQGEMLDKGLVSYFPAPHSFTGEDCAEFHLHGSKALISRFLAELGEQEQCRPAEAGEFARRAFANGKIDLTQAEGLADLLTAETESQRKLAMQGASGALKKLYRDWRQRLIKARAMIEAELDFAEEEEVKEAVFTQTEQDLAALHQDLQQHIAQAKTAYIMRDGLKIVIAGAPNAGKSSFINRLSGRSAALVSSKAGTTRDALEIRLIIEGIPVLVTDTAGLRQTTEQIEQMGVETACARIKEADLVLYLADMHAETSEDNMAVALPATKAEIWSIGNKLDLGVGAREKWPFQLSVETGLGWAEFMQKLQQFCREKTHRTAAILPARSRQLHLLKTAAAELDKALHSKNAGLELQAEYLRYAANALGRITGDIDVEDLLNVIFSEFCIGK
ncbi:MAG: tRNA uridine-5-carboxymethylaminomethyl(34) synthesis GTPase MnmE [Candidatus Tokpelaia sp.]|nr:MAG: tRNA uridine-5-carboxymethylaminomethyl(34) synthesis GTPase MnmE [Candidatus Tokpelaia sp.]